jgi:hypothetical protein
MHEPIIVSRLCGAVPSVTKSGGFYALLLRCSIDEEHGDLRRLDLHGSWRDWRHKHLVPVDFDALGERVTKGAGFDVQFSVTDYFRSTYFAPPQAQPVLEWCPEPLLTLQKQHLPPGPWPANGTWEFLLYLAQDAPVPLGEEMDFTVVDEVVWRRIPTYPGPGWWYGEGWRAERVDNRRRQQALQEFLEERWIAEWGAEWGKHDQIQ